jgi:hypothetical protein
MKGQDPLHFPKVYIYDGSLKKIREQRQNMWLKTGKTIEKCWLHHKNWPPEPQNYL